MTKYEFSQILTLIDDWVDSLEEDQLNEQCRKSGKSFFDFMKARNANIGRLVNIITEFTGYHPRKLFTIDDARLLKESIRSYESCEADISYHDIQDQWQISERAEFWFRGVQDD